MPPSDESAPPFQSTFPELRVPDKGWQSNIPEHLLIDTDPQTVWLMTEISKNTQATNFACQGVVDMSKHLRAQNGKTFKNERAAAENKDDLDMLKTQAKAVAPFIKPVMQFAALWEFRPFRWVFYVAAFFFFTYLLPWYLKNPFDLGHVFDLVFGGK